MTIEFVCISQLIKDYRKNTVAIIKVIIVWIKHNATGQVMGRALKTCNHECFNNTTEKTSALRL